MSDWQEVDIVGRDLRGVGFSSTRCSTLEPELRMECTGFTRAAIKYLRAPLGIVFDGGTTPEILGSANENERIH